MCSYVLYYVHQKWTVYSLYIDCWEVPRPSVPKDRLSAPERCWFLLWCICFTKLKQFKQFEHLAERSNISDFYRRKPASLSVSSCQEATSTPCSTQTLDCASGSGTQRMLRHDCMVATCLPKGWFCQVSVGLVSRCVVHQHGIGVQLHLDPTCWHSVVQPIDVTCCYQKPCGKRAIGNNRNHWCVFHLSSGDNSSFEDVWGSTRNFKLINSIRLLKV